MTHTLDPVDTTAHRLTVQSLLQVHPDLNGTAVAQNSTCTS